VTILRIKGKTIGGKHKGKENRKKHAENGSHEGRKWMKK
jgi:hypothetical protein